ncbi:oxygenase MpaB family protein [Mycolicibacterium xanthum]|uniref:oxygenase MpaB family protein n=1 Tax=Mycolicibacterium xanthum TaxID=2796469 RepID=UPI0021036A48|nr:oxygenase MpaB family protein [Mycolicibacterium xanthum]
MTAPRSPACAAELLMMPNRRGATASVIMQLALPPVGYGVLESRVDSGNVMKHPLHRARTTATYLAVAMLGTDDEKNAYRAAVGGSHRHVRSTESSPVSYNAFDGTAQRWVAACLYRLYEDSWGLCTGRPGSWLPDDIYRQCATLGTTLQVRDEQWPADRAAFEEYWQQGLSALHIDPPVRNHLERLLGREQWGVAGRIGLDRHRFYTTGFLHEPVRSMMGLQWTAEDQREFEARMAGIGRRILRLPPRLRRPIPELALADLRRRRRNGLPLI